MACEGINGVDLSPAIGSVTINYSGRKLSRARLEELLQRGIDSSRESPKPAVPEGNPLTQDAHLGALLLTLAVTPLLPTPLRYLATSLAISPTLWNSLTRLRLSCRTRVPSASIRWSTGATRAAEPPQSTVCSQRVEENTITPSGR